MASSMVSYWNIFQHNSKHTQYLICCLIYFTIDQKKSAPITFKLYSISIEHQMFIIHIHMTNYLNV